MFWALYMLLLLFKGLMIVKIQIIGFAGAGKSTLAETIEKSYKIPRLCLDNVHFLKNGMENNKEDDTL